MSAGANAARTRGRALAWLAGVAALLLTLGCQSGAPTPAQAAPAAPVAIGVVINEILAHTDPPQVDAVELYNPGPDPVDISGWYLSDDKDDLRQYQFPAAPPSVIAAGDYLVVGGDSLPFALSEFGEKLYLSQPATNGALQTVDVVSFGVSPNGVSLGRYRTSTGAVDFPLQKAVTLGAANAGPRVGPVVISEIMYNPAAGSEYVVLTNISAELVPLYDPQHLENQWQVQGFGADGGAYVLPPGVVLGPGASLVIAADPVQYRADHPAPGVLVLGPASGKLDNQGEKVILQQPQPPEDGGPVHGNCAGKELVSCADIDTVEYGVDAPWPSQPDGHGPALLRKALDQYGNDPANWEVGTRTLSPAHGLALPFVHS